MHDVTAADAPNLLVDGHAQELTEFRLNLRDATAFDNQARGFVDLVAKFNELWKRTAHSTKIGEGRHIDRQDAAAQLGEPLVTSLGLRIRNRRGISRRRAARGR